jgi:hypothetical protein
METSLLKKSNSIQDSGGNEKNGYPFPNLHKTMINVTKSDTYIKNSQRRNPGRYHLEIHGEDTRYG